MIARFSGSGPQNTRRFRIPGSGDWKLRWSYSCAAFGSIGIFIVSEDRADMHGVSVIQKGGGGRGVTYAYNDTGSHFLTVNSECSWRMTAISQA